MLNCWVNHPDFLELVKASWIEPAEGNPLVLLQKKLKRLKPVLKQLHRDKLSQMNSRIKEKKEELLLVNRENLKHRDGSVDVEKERLLFFELMELSRTEESIIRQKSRSNGSDKVI